jgi:hypothetical protein
MDFLDLCGAPGSGKSTLADAFWHPHAFTPEDRLPPVNWHDFINEIGRLFYLIRKHPTIGAAVRMNNRSVRKMATVARMEGETHYSVNLDGMVPKPYIQTGLVQRGLGFGWRMVDLGIDINELRHFFRLMPVSIGVVVTRCPPEIVAQRNRDREKVAATRHENREHMIPLMAPAIELAIEVLRGRHVPVWEISTTQPVEDARAQLLTYASNGPCDASQMGLGGEMEAMQIPPPWWR